MALKNIAKTKIDTKSFVKGMKTKLAKCGFVSVKIPIDKQNPKDKEVIVQINGYIYQIERGVEVEVPKPVKVLLERGGFI